MAQYALGQLSPTDAPQLAVLHQTAFPGFFLSNLGETFLRQFYLGFLGDKTAVTVIAHDSTGTVIGAVVGSTDPNGFFGRLLRRRLAGFAFASATAALRHPSTIPRLLRAIKYRGDSPRGQGALLSSICVDPATRTQGLGRNLLAQWELQARLQGARHAFLSTDADGNERVNAFYQRAGWTVASTYKTREGRLMNLYGKKLS